MESKIASYQTIARAVRVEHDVKTDTIFLVFEVVDESFKQRIKNDWMQDIEVQIIGKDLVG